MCMEKLTCWPTSPDTSADSQRLNQTAHSEKARPSVEPHWKAELGGY